jgi:uncharacterized protein (TIGR00369 family)
MSNEIPIPSELRGGCPTLPVADFDRAVAFYTETLGLTLLVRFGDEWACLDAGDGLFIGLVPRRKGDLGPSVSLCVSGSIEDVVETLGQRGVNFEGAIVNDGPVKIAFFTDPDGNALHLADSPPNPTTGFGNSSDEGTDVSFLAYLGLRWNTLHGDRASVELDIRDTLRGPAGILQGGITATLVDVAAASTVALAGCDVGATTEMTIHYLSPGRIGPVRAVGELLRSGARGFAVEVRVYDVGEEDRLMAVALGAFSQG